MTTLVKQESKQLSIQKNQTIKNVEKMKLNSLERKK